LLGEVLMRRADYERAVPVLQHAQNLAPADPTILTLLRRARNGEPLDPPPALADPGEVAADANVLGRVELDRRAQPPHDGPVEREPRRVDGRGDDRQAQRPVEVHQPPPREDPLAPLAGAGQPAV